MNSDLIWSDKKRPIFGKALSFTEYRLYADRLVVHAGLFRRKTEQIMLYRILDVTMSSGILDRIFGVGTLHICSGDRSASRIAVQNIHEPEQIYELLGDMVERARTAKRIRPLEFLEGE